MHVRIFESLQLEGLYVRELTVMDGATWMGNEQLVQAEAASPFIKDVTDSHWPMEIDSKVHL